MQPSFTVKTLRAQLVKIDQVILVHLSLTFTTVWLLGNLSNEDDDADDGSN